jgi:hypothetical protein
VKRSVQDTSEATSKRAKVVENSNAAAKGCEQDGDREAIVKSFITAFREGNEAESKKLYARINNGYLNILRKMRADCGEEEIARFKQIMEDLFSTENMTLERNKISWTSSDTLLILFLPEDGWNVRWLD